MFWKYILFIILFLKAMPVTATWQIGVGTFLGDISAKEDKTGSSNSSYYFEENDESSRTSVGLNLFIYKEFSLFENSVLSIGPYLEYGFLIVNDDYPTGFSAEGKYNYGFGVDIKLLLRSIPVVQPYLKFGLGNEWSEIEVQFDANSPYVTGTNSSFIEESFGPRAHIYIGGIYKFNNINIFAELGFIKKYFSTTLTGEYSSSITVNNKYISNEIRIIAGVLVRPGAI